MIYPFKCSSCGAKEDRDVPVSEIVGHAFPCENCNGVMKKDYSQAKIFVDPEFSSTTQSDWMDPRAYAGKGTQERRDFVNETWGEKEPLFGNPQITELEPFVGAK